MIKHEKNLNPTIKFLQNNIVIIISSFSFIFCISYKFVFVEINEFLPYASKIGEVMYDVMLSILASSIFYFFIVYLKEKRDKRKVRQLINMRLEQIEMMKNIIYSDILKSSNYKVENNSFPESPKEFEKIVENMKLTEKPPLYFAGTQLANIKDWYEYFEYNFEYDKHNIEILYKHLIFLNPSTIQLLHDISTCMFISAIHQYKREKYKSEYAIYFKNLSGPLYQYLKLLGDLKKDCWL